MNFSSLFCFFVILFSYTKGLNNRPIVGVLTVEPFKYNVTTHIYASYVKFLEAAGARVVPIWIYKQQDYYEDLLSKLNGVLFPGGSDLLNGPGYGRSGKIIFDIAKKMNDRGDYFPLWGTCLGFELLNYMAVQKFWMMSCLAEDLPTNIDFVKGFQDSRMFKDLDKALLNTMQKKNVAIHFHQWCITPKNYTLSGLNKYYKTLAVNQDSRNITFISIIEAYKYPFYGTSFHPEKIQFEWALLNSSHNVPHTFEAVKVSQYFGNFFVNEARKSSHSFPNESAAQELLIYNYNPKYTGKSGKTAQQIYYFDL